jgi:hypothetical protein
MWKKFFLFILIIAGFAGWVVSCQKQTQITPVPLPMSVTLLTLNDWTMDSMVFHFTRIDTSVIKNTDSSISYPRNTSAINFKAAKLHIAADSTAANLSFWFMDTSNTALIGPPTAQYPNGDTTIYQYIQSGRWGLGNYYLADTFAFVNNADTSVIYKWKIQGLSTSFLNFLSVDSSLKNTDGTSIYRNKMFYFSHPSQ